MQHGGKKIDVDELKTKLAEGIRRTAKTGSSTLDASVSFANNNLSMSNTFTRKSGKSATRSKSPGTFLEDVPERGSAAKVSVEAEPAWYKALKKNIK